MELKKTVKVTRETLITTELDADQLSSLLAEVFAKEAGVDKKNVTVDFDISSYAFLRGCVIQVKTICEE